MNSDSNLYAQIDAFDVQAQRMSDLVHKLAGAHRTAEADFLASANTSLANVRAILVASVVMLLALVAAIGWVIYRDTIAPLRTNLVRSQPCSKSRKNWPRSARWPLASPLRFATRSHHSKPAFTHWRNTCGPCPPRARTRTSSAPRFPASNESCRTC